LLLIVGFAGLMFWLQRSGEAHQEKFFAAVATGNPENVMALFHPALREEVDAPVLAAWIKAVNEHLGRFQGLAATSFSTSTKYEQGVKITESHGTVHFEKGTAESELSFRDDQLVSFKVESETIPDDWFNGPADSDTYRQKGAKFLQHFLRDESDAAQAMMHPALQKLVPLEKLKTMTADVGARTGKLDTVSYQSESFETGEDQVLTITYDLACEKQTTTATVKFQFVDMKGHLLAFDVAYSDQ